MSFEIEGLVHKIFETENKTDSFRAREFVIRTEENYPQFVKFQLVQDRCELVDHYQENERIKVFFDLRGREWNGKYFTNLNAWKLEKVSEVNHTTEDQGLHQSLGNNVGFPANEPENLETDKNFDDLPF